MAKDKSILSDYTNSFIGGMITRYTPEQLPPHCVSLARNVVFDNNTAAKRNGFTKLNSSELAAAAAVRSLYIGKGGGSITNKIIAISAGKIYSLTTGGVATERATGLNATQRWSFTEGLLSGTQRIVMVAPNNAPYQWDGSAASASTFTGPATNGDYTMFHQECLWIADADLRTLYKSNRNVMSTWNALDFIIVGHEDDGPITGIISMGRYAVIFMQNAVYILTGNRIRYPANVSLERVLLEDGCPSPWSITKIQDKIFWSGNDGFYVLEGRSAKKISYGIKAEFDAINRSYLDIIQGGRVGDYWLVSVPHSSSTTNSRTYCIHWSLPPGPIGDYPVSYWDGLLANSFTYAPNTEKMYFGSQTAGFIYYYDTSLWGDDGAAVPFELITRGLSFGDLYAEKALTKIQPQLDVVSSGTLVVSARPNESTTDTECPASTTASPLALDSTGVYMGEYGGDSSFARNGIVHYPLIPASSGEFLYGTWFRARFYDSSTRNMILRRVYYEAIPKAR